MTSPIELENELYAGLPDAVRQELSSHGAAMTVERGALLVEKGAIPDRLTILNAGTAETTVAVAGKDVSLGIARPGKVFALHSIITGTAPDITVTCLEECRVTIVPKDVFLEVLARNPQMYFAVVKVLSSDLAMADRVIRDCAHGVPAKSSSPVFRPA
jgi:CRP/FNR family transcriptional regulator, cyclic AMP receptor protein